MKITIADYNNREHGKDILYLLNEYAQDPLGGGEPLSEFARDNLLTALAEIPGAFSVLCYIDSNPVGLANCFQGFSTFKCKPLINIHDIVVIQEHRGQGISQALIKKIESVATERQCCKLTLEVLQGNHHAISAYKKFGFAPYELNQEYGYATFWEKELKY
ncbi:MAG: GNAT family N-acetyltransferase [Gammaproteobacteria bacterium]|nr:GNAT family N-acetyltransferase [Gammaproteobacteria bacterium]